MKWIRRMSRGRFIFWSIFSIEILILLIMWAYVFL